MNITTADSLKEQLMTTDPDFRELVREHGRYEQRLSELSALAYPRTSTKSVRAQSTNR